MKLLEAHKEYISEWYILTQILLSCKENAGAATILSNFLHNFGTFVSFVDTICIQGLTLS